MTESEEIYVNMRGIYRRRAYRGAVVSHSSDRAIKKVRK